MDSQLRTSGATNVRWMIFAIICMASFLTYVHRYTWGVVRPFLREEADLTDGQLGWLDAAFNLTYALAQYPSGLAGDVLGPRVVIPVVAVLWSLAMAGPALVSTFWGLAAVRLLFGATQAASYPNLGKITKSWFPISIRTSVQGFVATLSGRAGGACASLIMASVLIGALELSWRQALGALAAVGLLFAALFWLVFRDRPAAHPWANEAEQQLVEAGDPPIPRAAARFNWSGENIRNFGFFLAASFSSTFAVNLFVSWMPQFLKTEKGFDPVAMGIYASLPLLGGAAGGFFGGVLNDVLIRATGNRRQSRRLVASAGKTIAALLIAVSLIPDDGRAVMVVLLVCKFFSDWTQPTWWGTVTDIGGPSAGQVFGIANMVGSIGGTAAGPAMGYVKEYLGWGALFLFVGCVYLLTALSWAFVDCTRSLIARTDTK